jgi:hypothetical protein
MQHIETNRSVSDPFVPKPFLFTKGEISMSEENKALTAALADVGVAHTGWWNALVAADVV